MRARTTNKTSVFRVGFLIAALFLLLHPCAASAKEVWTRVRSQNFELTGNASENRIRAVARNLEQFREFFRQQFPQLNLNSSLPLRVVVFNEHESYRPFQPLRQDGSADAAAIGYFHPGLEANYIVFPINEKNAAVPSTIYHEYVHFVVQNNLQRADIPPWLNEGLAEYFQTFRAENDRVVLGESQAQLVRLLETETLIPFETFFKTDRFVLQNQGNHSRTVFYAQSWALAHYFQNGTRRADFDKFLTLLLAGESVENAFKTAFRIDNATLEKELKNYLEAKQFPTATFALKTIPDAELKLQAAAVSESEAATVLGHLLLQQNRFAEAVVLLDKAVKTDDSNAEAHASLGVALTQQKKFAAAEPHFEKALRIGANGFLTSFLYGYALYKQEENAAGYIKAIPAAKAAKMRALLRKSIELNPNFAPAYQVLANVNLINGEDLGEAIEFLKTAIRLEPGNLRSVFDLAQVNLRLTNYIEAEILAEKVFQSTADKDLRLQAQSVAISARNIRAQLNAMEIQEIEAKQAPVQAISQEEGLLQALNEALRIPRLGEQRVLGTLTEIECRGKSSTFVVQSANPINNTLIFNAPELQKVQVKTFAPDLEGRQIGCETKKMANYVVLTYRPAKETNAKYKGEVVSIEFVPSYFRFML
ncbi:MAG: tetratricopeptide repeat protein [Acidobacteriota bacterium]|nr:tetratricopeptide repeat protein [Acidobacteriota bacterium]